MPEDLTILPQEFPKPAFLASLVSVLDWMLSRLSAFLAFVSARVLA
jgi:hypothetical protein